MESRRFGGRGSFAIEPVFHDQEIAVQARFVAARSRRPIVAPTDERRERKKNRFGAPAGLQTEQRTAIPDQIEFDIPAAPIRLEIPLALAIRLILAPRQNRLVGREKVIADRLRQRETALEAAVGDIIEKNAADPARFAAMLEKKILVAPALVLT